MTDRLTEVVRDGGGRITGMIRPAASELAEALELARATGEQAYRDGAQAAADAAAPVYSEAGARAGLEAGVRAAIEALWPYAVASGFRAGRQFETWHPGADDPAEIRAALAQRAT